MAAFLGAGVYHVRLNYGEEIRDKIRSLLGLEPVSEQFMSLPGNENQEIVGTWDEDPQLDDGPAFGSSTLSSAPLTNQGSVLHQQLTYLMPPTLIQILIRVCIICLSSLLSSKQED